jgi:hypothetical protein
MQSLAVRCCNKLWAVCGLASLLTGLAGAETFQLKDGQTLTGDPISFDEKGLIVREPDGRYSERTPWLNFSQADLKAIATNPKAARFVRPFLEVSPEAKARETAIPLQPVPRLERPPAGSLLGALFSSTVGLAVLFVLYLANIYAGREIAILRAQPVPLVCGLAAVVPIVGPIVFLCLPTRLTHAREETAWTETESPSPAEPAAAPGEPAPRQPAAGLALAPPDVSEVPAVSETKTFARGQFMFNRRFFETKFPGFFGMAQNDAASGMVLVIKSARGVYVAQRITRIAANDLHVKVPKGALFEEVMIPFVEIQEVQLQHQSTP